MIELTTDNIEDFTVGKLTTYSNVQQGQLLTDLFLLFRAKEITDETAKAFMLRMDEAKKI